MTLETSPYQEPVGNGRTRGQPTNALSQWLETFRLHPDRNFSNLELGRRIDLHGLPAIKARPSERISLYTIEAVLKWISSIEPGITSEEMDSLANAVEQVISEQLARNGSLYDRIPPRVAKYQQEVQKSGQRTYRDIQLARELSERPERIRRVRHKLGIDTPVFTGADAERIAEYIKSSKEAKTTKLPEVSGASLPPLPRSGRAVSGAPLEPIPESVKQPGRRHKRPDVVPDENRKATVRTEEYKNTPLFEEYRAIIAEVLSRSSVAEQPEVLTRSYLDSLIPSDRKSVEKLRGSSFRYGVKIEGQDRLNLEYLIREKVYPPGATIKRNRSGEYYLEHE